MCSYFRSLSSQLIQVLYISTYQQLTLQSHWWDKRAGRWRSCLTRCRIPGVREGRDWAVWQPDWRGCWRTDSKGCPRAEILTSPEGERKWNVVLEETGVTLFLCSCNKIIISKKSVLPEENMWTECMQNFRLHRKR